jgi:hypothetical protein
MDQKQLKPYLYTVVGILGVIILGVFIRQCSKKSDIESFDRIKYVEVTPVKVGQLLRKIKPVCDCKNRNAGSYRKNSL